MSPLQLTSLSQSQSMSHFAPAGSWARTGSSGRFRIPSWSSHLAQDRSREEAGMFNVLRGRGLYKGRDLGTGRIVGVRESGTDLENLRATF